MPFIIDLGALKTFVRSGLEVHKQTKNGVHPLRFRLQ